MSKHKKAIFVHIPKTGGSTLHDIIIREYGKDRIFHVKNNRELGKFVALSEDKKNKIELLKGHMAFGHHNKFPHPEEISYFSFMRDPVKRIISNYYHILSRKNHDFHDELVNNNYSLKQYVESGIIANTENAQVRLLANAIETPHNKCSRELLDQAKLNIENHFSVVGINELYDESLLLLKEFYQWKTPYYVRRNKTNYTAKPTDLDKETLDTIISHNQLDIELYNWAKERLLNQINNHGDEFKNEVKKFKNRNKIIQKIVLIKNFIIRRKSKL